MYDSHHETPFQYRDNVTQRGIQGFLDGRPLSKIREECRELSRSSHTPISTEELNFERLENTDDRELNIQIRAASAEHRAALNELSIYNGSSALLTVLTMADHLSHDADPPMSQLSEDIDARGYTKAPLYYSTLYPKEFIETTEVAAGQMTLSQQQLHAYLGDEFIASRSHADGRGRYYHAMLCALNEEWRSRRGERHHAVLERLLDRDPRTYLEEDWRALQPTGSIEQYLQPDASSGIDDSDLIFNVSPVTKSLWISALAIEQRYPNISHEDVTRILLGNVDKDLGHLARGRIATTEIIKMDMPLHYGDDAGRFSTLIEHGLNPSTAPQLDENDVISFPTFTSDRKGRCPISYHAKLDSTAHMRLENFLDSIETTCGSRPKVTEGPYIDIAPLFTTMIIYYASRQGGFLERGVTDLTKQFLSDVAHYPVSAW